MKASPVDRELLDAARLVRESAYAPYSNFRVGAALRGKSGRVYTGCNVENISLGLSICAERVALGRAIADGEREFAALCVVTQSKKPSPPCGLCRQALREFCRDLHIVLANINGSRLTVRLAELLPRAFDKSYL